MIITVCVIPWIPGMQWMMRPQLPLIVSFCSARAAGPAILCINNMLGVSDSCTTHHCFLSKGQTGNLLAGVDWGQIKAVCSSCPHLLRQGNMYFPHLLILTFGVLFHLEKMQNCNSDNITCSGSYLPSHSKTTPSHFKQHSNIVNLCFALFQLIKYKDFFWSWTTEHVDFFYWNPTLIETQMHTGKTATCVLVGLGKQSVVCSEGLFPPNLEVMFFENKLRQHVLKFVEMKMNPGPLLRGKPEEKTYRWFYLYCTMFLKGKYIYIMWIYILYVHAHYNIFTIISWLLQICHSSVCAREYV